MSNPTADWEKVGDKYYRKTQLYTAVFDQDLELDNYIVVGAPYGGAIGMLVQRSFADFSHVPPFTGLELVALNLWPLPVC